MTVPRLLPDRRSARFLLLALGAFGLGVAYLAADWWWALPEGEVAQYVGRQACAECHAQEVEAWSGSDHDRAMDPATPETVLGNFEDQRLEHFGVVSSMFRRGGEFFITTDNRQGRLETFRIAYVLGYRPLQQYLVEFPDGRVQCLPIAWDIEKKRWFHLYPDEPIPHDDPLHWTRAFQNWNYMCADCHTTNLQKNYDLAHNGYRTTFSEMDVSCEACHGPGSLHVRIAKGKKVFWDRRYGYGLVRLKEAPWNVAVETCAPCHAHRRILYPGFQPGKPFLDHYMPALLDGELYWPDGQIREEVYEYTSFLQSRMYHEKVRCTDCHDPHTTRVKFPDNRLCGQCHLPTKYDTPTHHHHPDSEKPGTRCTECHMPKTTYMVVDPRLDHSIRVPRPDLTVALGIPNACTGCHHDAAKGETPQWAAAKVEEWYGPRKDPPHFAYAIDAARKHKPEAAGLLLEVIRRKDTRPIVRASAVALLGSYPGFASESAVRDALEDADPLVRAAAVRSIESLYPVQGRAVPAAAMADPNRRRLHELLSPLLHDPIRAVRIEAARVLTLVSDQERNPEDQKAFQHALEEYLAGQEFLADQPAAHLNMAVVYANRGQPDKAESHYRQALRIDPGFVPAGVNLAMLLDEKGCRDEAEAQFRSVIAELKQQLGAARRQAAMLDRVGRTAEASPSKQRPIDQMIEHLCQQTADCHFSLGLLLAERKERLADAAAELAAAVRLAPRNPRIHYNLGLAYQNLGRKGQAEESLRTARQLAPAVPDYHRALAIFYAQQRRWDEAVQAAEQLLALDPRDREAQALLSHLLEQRGAAADPTEGHQVPAPKP